MTMALTSAIDEREQIIAVDLDGGEAPAPGSLFTVGTETFMVRSLYTGQPDVWVVTRRHDATAHDAGTEVEPAGRAAIISGGVHPGGYVVWVAPGDG
jgi:hypothetical protein